MVVNLLATLQGFHHTWRFRTLIRGVTGRDVVRLRNQAPPPKSFTCSGSTPLDHWTVPIRAFTRR